MAPGDARPANGRLPQPEHRLRNGWFGPTASAATASRAASTAAVAASPGSASPAGSPATWLARTGGLRRAEITEQNRGGGTLCPRPREVRTRPGQPRLLQEGSSRADHRAEPAAGRAASAGDSGQRGREPRHAAPVDQKPRSERHSADRLGTAGRDDHQGIRRPVGRGDFRGKTSSFRGRKSYRL